MNLKTPLIMTASLLAATLSLALPNLDALVDSEYKHKTNFYAGMTQEKAKESIKSDFQHNLWKYFMKSTSQPNCRFAEMFG